MTDHAPAPTLDELRHAPALAADPRPGTRALADSALGVLGIELLLVRAARTVLRMPAPTHADRGTLLVLAESAASTAAGHAVGPSRRAFGAELDASFLTGPADELVGPLLAEATPLVTEPHRHTWRIVVTDAAGVRVLESRCTLGIVNAPA
ncbi:MAG: PaaI family thioesterase [Thermoleophilia bacterium]|nr:PaaI family thioesterase [Thermoleophilia bacterium]